MYVGLEIYWKQANAMRSSANVRANINLKKMVWFRSNTDLEARINADSKLDSINTDWLEDYVLLVNWSLALSLLANTCKYKSGSSVDGVDGEGAEPEALPPTWRIARQRETTMITVCVCKQPKSYEPKYFKC